MSYKDKQLIVFKKTIKLIQKRMQLKNGYFKVGKVYVLINENSASMVKFLAGT
jgi:C-terminal processing protease CtpA/Prc